MLIDKGSTKPLLFLFIPPLTQPDAFLCNSTEGIVIDIRLRQYALWSNLEASKEAAKSRVQRKIVAALRSPDEK